MTQTAQYPSLTRTPPRISAAEQLRLYKLEMQGARPLIQSVSFAAPKTPQR